MEANRGNEIRLVLIADPDAPQQVAEVLPDELPGWFDGERKWTVVVEVDPLTAGRNSLADMVRAAREHRRENDGHYAICISDLPLRSSHRPVLAEADLDEGIAVISLPALGGTQPYRRTRQILTQMLDELIEPGEGSRRNHGLDSWLTRLIAPIYRESTFDLDAVDIRYRTTKRRGRLRLLSGMVRTNRPWRLAFGMSRALTAALAASAFGLSSSTVWQIGDRLEPVRQVLAAFFSVGLLVFWLIVAHHLWEKRRTRSAPDHEQVVLYNASTVVTLSVGVGCIYVALFIANLGVAAFFVPPPLLASILGHSSTWVGYLNLAWGFTTMGMVAGALGSSLETDAAVRQAAYGYREEQRRAMYQHQQRNGSN